MNNFWDGFNDQLEKNAGPVTFVSRGLGKLYGGGSRALQSASKGATSAGKSIRNSVTSAGQFVKDTPNRAYDAFVEGTVKRAPKKPLVAAAPASKISGGHPTHISRVTPAATSAPATAVPAATSAPAAAQGRVAGEGIVAPLDKKAPLTGWRKDGNRLITGGLIGAGGTYLATRGGEQGPTY